jgi:3-oxoacyl-[acyl-carrier-protein] synthase I
MLAITGLGLASSLGDVVTACAAERCGMSRPGPMEDVEVTPDDTTNPPSFLNGHPCKLFSPGFSGTGRWVNLAARSLSDLAVDGRFADLDPTALRRTCLFVVLPAEEEERFPHGLVDVDEVGLRACEWSGVGLQPSQVFVRRAAGTEGVANTLMGIVQELSARRWDRAILLAVDSYLDSSSLRWLQIRDRLKVPENPIGLAPGEAAAAVLLEDPNSARNRRVQVDALLDGVCVRACPKKAPPVKPENEETENEETDIVDINGIELGRSLADAAVTALRHGQQQNVDTGWLIADHNGEQWRAETLGNAMLHMQAQGVRTRWTQKFPAMSFGDTGIASAAIGICVATRGFRRGYAPPGSCCVLSTETSGQVAAIVLHPPIPGRG